MEEKLFSICIPSYNRPAEIRRLLNSIDTTHVDEVEIESEINEIVIKLKGMTDDDFKEIDFKNIIEIEEDI